MKIVEEAISIESFAIRGFLVLESGHIDRYEVLVREKVGLFFFVFLCVRI